MNTATALKANTADTVKMTIRQWARYREDDYQTMGYRRPPK